MRVIYTVIRGGVSVVLVGYVYAFWVLYPFIMAFQNTVLSAQMSAQVSVQIAFCYDFNEICRLGSFAL